MRKLLFGLCLSVPLILIGLTQLKPYYDNYRAVTGATSVIRQIPLGKPQLADAFKDRFQKFAVPVKPVPVKPKAPLPPLKPVAPKAPPHVTVKKVAPAPLPLEPVEQQPIEFCAFWGHCGYLQ